MIDDDQLAHGELAACRRLRDARGELVPEHARILEEGLTSPIDMVVGAANSDAKDFQSHFISFERRDHARLQNELARSTTNDGFHVCGISFSFGNPAPTRYAPLRRFFCRLSR